MAEKTSSNAATGATAPPPRRGGSGFVGGLVGGVLAAGGAIVALQYPQVREQIPLPEEATLIIEPEQVRRINALEEFTDTLASKTQVQAFESELRAVRAAVGAAEESSTLDAISERLDLVSQGLAGAATAEQLDALSVSVDDRFGESATTFAPLSAIDELNATVEAASADLTAKVESSVAATEAAVTTLESTQITLNALLSDVAALKEAAAVATGRLDGIDAGLAQLEAGVDSLDDSLNTAVGEATAALTGRIDATARDLTAFRTDYGASVAQMTALGASLSDLEATLGTALQSVRSDIEGLTTRADQTEEQQRGVISTMTENRRAGIAAYEEVSQAVEQTRVQLQSATELAVAAAAEAKAAADEAGNTVTTALARSTIGGIISATAAEIGGDLSQGAAFEPPLANLAALSGDGLSPTENETLQAALGTLEPLAGGVVTAAALQRSFVEARVMAEIAAPGASDEDPGTGGRLLRQLLKPTNTDASVVGVLDAMGNDLANGDIDAALAKADALPEASLEALSLWKAAAEDRQAALAAQRQLSTLGRSVSASAAGASRS